MDWPHKLQGRAKKMAASGRDEARGGKDKQIEGKEERTKGGRDVKAQGVGALKN